MMGMGTVTRRSAFALIGTALLAAGGWSTLRTRRQTRIEALYRNHSTKPEGPFSVFHLGHSMVGRDMPSMLAQIAGKDHSYASQLGWGASLRDHWEPGIPVNGFAEENAHSAHQPAHEALLGGSYDAVVLTEMINLDDAIRYHDSAAYLAKWAQVAHQNNPGVRVYLYETWHHTDDPEGWGLRLDRDIDTLWTQKLALPAADQAGVPIWIIPAGQVLAAYLATRTSDMPDREAIFARTPEGAFDTIHMGDLGNYLVALVHFAALYQRSPEGRPHALLRADGTAATAPDARTALHMQRIAWQVTRDFHLSGVSV